MVPPEQVLLVGTGNPVLSGELGLLATASVLLMALVITAVAIAQRWLGMRFAQAGAG